MKSKVILISAKQGSGKTTLQLELQRQLFKAGILAMSMNFADEIYLMHDFALNRLKHYKIAPEEIIKDGRLLQLLGTEWGRTQYGADVWVNIIKARIDAVLEMNKDSQSLCVPIIGDCRFRNEFDAFPDALKIRLECPREVRKSRCSSWRENDTHPSEVDLDEYVAQSKFDLIYQTGFETTEYIANSILKELNHEPQQLLQKTK